MSDLTLTVDRSTRKVTAGLGDAAPFTLGDKVRFSLSIVRKTGDTTEASDLPVRALRASIGRTLAPPDSGTFSLASETLAAVPVAVDDVGFDATAEVMLAAMADLLWVTAVAKPAACTWVLTSSRTENDAAPPTFTLTANSLAPSSFVRLRPYIESGYWQVEIRLIHEPLAFTSTVTRVLATQPSVRRILAGGQVGDSGIFRDEIQSLTWPAAFDGTIALVHDFRRTQILGQQDGPDEIARALNALYTDGKVRFLVTNPVNNEAYIQFTGLLGAAGQNLITVEVNTFSPGALTFTLDLGRAPMATAFRGVDAKGNPVTSLVLPFEITADIVEDGEDPEDLDNQARPYTLLQTNVTVVREQIWDELATVEAIDWVRPPQPVSYVPYVANQVVTGQQHYSVVIGDGAASVFNIPHGLGTRLLACPPMVAENADGGAIYAYGLDYTATITDADSVQLTFASPPSAASLMVTVTSSGPKTAFVTGVTFTEAQVVGLLDDLAALASRLSDVESLVATPSALVRTDGSGESTAFTLPDFLDVWPGRLPATFSKAAVFSANFNAATMPRPKWLFPAIHDATISSAIVPIPSASAHAGKVFINDTSDALLVPGGGGLASASVPVGGYYGTDGRAWYALSAVADTSSFHPSGYERELFLLPVSERQLRTGKSLSLSAVLVPGIARATSRMKCFLSVETGLATSQEFTAFACTGNASTDIITASAHGLFAGVPVQFQTLTGGAGLATDTTYWLRNITTNTFKLAATEGGAAVNFTTNISAATLRVVLGENLEAILWNPVPMLLHPILLSAALLEVPFGVKVLRSTGGTLTAEQTLYAATSAAGAVPAAPTFVLRGRLLRFDTENNVSDAHGYMAAQCRAIEVNIA